MAKKKSGYPMLSMDEAEKIRLAEVAKGRYAKIGGRSNCPHCGQDSMVLIYYNKKNERVMEWIEHEV